MGWGLVEVLLVEDNPADSFLISSILETGERPKHVSTAADGEAAIEFLQRSGKYASAPKPDLVLLDLRLPRLDGYEVLSFIKSEPSLCHIPVVVLSSSDRESDVQSAYDLRANCYLTKPVDLDDYFDLVRKIDEYWLTQVVLC